MLRVFIVAFFAGLTLFSGLAPAQNRPPRAQAGTVQTAAAHKPALGSKEIRISFQKSGECVLQAVGLGKFNCLGQPGVLYPNTFYISPADKKGTHYSSEYQVDLPYAILLWGQRGVYLHEGKTSLKATGGQPSHGCIRLAKSSAQRVYTWLDRRAKVTVSYPWTKAATQPANPVKPVAGKTPPGKPGPSVKTVRRPVTPPNTRPTAVRTGVRPRPVVPVKPGARVKPAGATRFTTASRQPRQRKVREPTWTF